jgi:hypothetical protein
VAELVFSLYGAFPKNRPAFVSDTLHSLRELGLVYNEKPFKGRYVFHAAPRSAAVEIEENAEGDRSGALFASAVDKVRGAHWPHLWMQVRVPHTMQRRDDGGATNVPVVVSLRELPVADTPAKYEGSSFYEVSMTLPMDPLLDVEREESSEEGLFWFTTQVFLPLFISREALYGKVDFDPTSARDVTPRHLEKLMLPDFFLINVLGAPYVRKYGLETIRALPVNPLALQKKWMMRTPEGALLFRARVETDRWNGNDEPPVDFYDWRGRFAILDGLERGANVKGGTKRYS